MRESERKHPFTAVRYRYLREPEVASVDLADEGQTVTVFAAALDELLFSDAERMKHTSKRADQDRLNWMIDVSLLDTITWL